MELFWKVLAVVAVVALAIQQVIAWMRTALRRRTIKVRSARAYEGEREAEGLLERLGYSIVAKQERCTWRVDVDGQSFEIDLRADYIVERRGRVFVAEVKTGQIAVSIETAATRRQLLEYRVAFGVDGVLLVDADRKLVNEVVFPMIGESSMLSENGQPGTALQATQIA